MGLLPNLVKTMLNQVVESLSLICNEDTNQVAMGFALA